MRLKKAIFIQSTEAPGRNDKVAFLQSTDPARRDCYVADLWLGTLGVMAGDDVYPMHMFRRLTVDADAAEAKSQPVDEATVAERRDSFLAAMSTSLSASDLAGLAAHESAEPKRRGRPPKA